MGGAALANIEDLFKEIQTGTEGLSDEEAKRRLLKMGLNVLPKSKRVSLARKIASQLKKPVQSSFAGRFVPLVS